LPRFQGKEGLVSKTKSTRKGGRKGYRYTIMPGRKGLTCRKKGRGKGSGLSEKPVGGVPPNLGDRMGGKKPKRRGRGGKKRGEPGENPPSRRPDWVGRRNDKGTERQGRSNQNETWGG